MNRERLAEYAERAEKCARDDASARLSLIIADLQRVDDDEYVHRVQAARAADILATQAWMHLHDSISRLPDGEL